MIKSVFQTTKSFNDCQPLISFIEANRQYLLSKEFIIRSKDPQMDNSENVSLNVMKLDEVNQVFTKFGNQYFNERKVAFRVVNGVQFDQVTIKLEKQSTDLSKHSSGQKTIKQVYEVVFRLIFDVDAFIVSTIVFIIPVQTEEKSKLLEVVNALRAQCLVFGNSDNYLELFKMSTQVMSQIDIISQKLETQLAHRAIQIQSGFPVDYVQFIEYLNDFYETTTFQTGIKQMLRNPKQITKADVIHNHPWENMIISHKADGVHCLVYLTQHTASVITEKGLKVYQLIKQYSNEVCLIEAEIMPDRIICYDLHQLADRQMYKLNYEERLTMLQSVCNQCKDLLIGKIPLEIKLYNKVPANCSADQLKQLFDRHYTEQPQSDGLIINTNTDYKRQIIWKWKPLDKLTVDFYVEKVQKFNRPGYSGFTLFSYISKKHLYEQKLVQFVKSTKVNIPGTMNLVLVPFQSQLASDVHQFYLKDSELSEQDICGKVCEFRYILTENRWELYRVREDKDPQKMQFGNYLSVAQTVFNSIINFIDFDFLYDVKYKTSTYFNKPRPTQYDKMTQYNNQVKKYVMNKYLKPNSTVLDIGCGNGQDIHKYAYLKIKKLIGVDKDMPALEEMLKRVAETKKSNIGKKIRYPVIQVQQMDVNSQIDDFKQLVSTSSVDSVVCNLAIHYILPHLQQVVNSFKVLKKDSVVILTFLDGNKVFEMLKASDGVLRLTEFGQTKYLIKQQYHSTGNDVIMQAVGQQIKIQLPFAESLYDEILVNSHYLIQIFGENDFDLEAEENFDKVADEQLVEYLSKLSTIDMEYVSLYKFMVFKKVI